ncbi:hypothetical protein LNP27_02105 [Flavobacterium galactosidilyticum]|uniref:hypothetical protein n=1 Tax=Flavobacterium galactosidilyticum TaxID=2893886 RepID=UPI001E359F48|nr:hypothetical protein [Flavobacterium sp. F-340]UFH46849.1 hypothetical protein LNP27_02105 [Flavobacterium sp. F-340]
MKNFLTILFIALFQIADSQNRDLSVVKLGTLSFDSDQFLGYDAFGFYYTIKNNVFSKISSREVLEYKNVSLGKITKTDLRNPLKIVLFYENFNSIILLDNKLNEIRNVNFSENSIPLIATAVGLSSQNQLWIYNSMNQQLGLYDYIKNEYKAITVPFTDTIKYYTSDFNHFQWIDVKNNWYSCDIFGKITFKGLIPDFDLLEICSENQYIYLKSGTLMLQDLEKDKNYEIKISEKTFVKFYYKDQILSIFTKEVITNYKIVTP